MTIRENRISSELPKWVKLIAIAIISVFFAKITFDLSVSYSDALGVFVYKEVAFFLLFAFLIVNVLIKTNVLYDFIFKNRYAIGLIIFVFLVAAKINFSNIGMFEIYIQTGKGSDFRYTLFGELRVMRSDEWAISTPCSLTYQYCRGEKYNDIIMAAQTPNSSATNISPSLAILAKPIYIGYLFLSAEYAVSFQWCGLFIMSILVINEFFLVITKEKKLLSFMGTVAIVGSSFFLWWSGVPAIAYGLGAVAFIYRFLNTEASGKRIIYGLAVAVLGSSFVCSLYPAWTVPAGYIYLAIIIWCFIVNFENIKKFRWYDWITFAGAIIFAIVIILTYYLGQREYVEAVSQTVYPGAREDYGGYSLYKLFNYPASLKFPFETGGFSVSENGVFFNLYPIPTILSVYLLFKSKKKDLLNILLLVVSLFLTIYCTVGFPAFFAKITLMSSSTPFRAVDMLGMLQILLLARSLSIFEDEQISVSKEVAILFSISFGIAVCVKCDSQFEPSSYMGICYLLVMIAFIGFLTACFIGDVSKKLKNTAMIAFCVVNIISAVNVLPVQVGLDVIYSKPVAAKIQDVVEEDPDAKWIAADQWIEANYYAACGARVINSNNYIPNMEMWQTLFPDGEYEEIYNRYSNLIIELTEEDTYLELNQPDLITLHLNYSDLETIGAKYIIRKSEVLIPENYSIDIDMLYAEDSIYIYKINY